MICGQPKGIRKIMGLYCCLIMGAYGCLRPPIREIGDAEAAIAAIRSAESGSYIAEELKHIEEKLARARLAFERKRFKEARTLALEAGEEARQAGSQAEERKGKAREEAERELTAAHRSLCDLEEKRLIRYNLEEYRDILTHFHIIQKKYGQEQYSEVIEKARSIISRCKDLQKRTKEPEESKNEAKCEKPEPSDESGWTAGPKKEQQKGSSSAFQEEQKYEEYEEYVVQVGDCLWTICQNMHVYSNPLSWPILYKANRAQIRNPDLIYPGQRFVIPR
ncbi:MAG: LysM peptidoglycan-binding domain-containing protein [bacterium]